MPRQTPKKSAMLEVRLPQEVKAALMARCQAENQSASEVVRAGIEAFLAGSSTVKETAMPKSRTPSMLAAMAAAGAAALFIASPGVAAPDLRAAFGRLDADGDGALTRAEFEAASRAEPVVVALSGTAKIVTSEGSSRAPASSNMAPAVRAPATEGGGEAAAVAATPVALDSPIMWRALEGEFARMDADDDNAVSLPEFVAARAAMTRAAFASADANNDGWLTANELSGHSLENGALRSLASQAIIRRYDQNNDGRLSYEEFAA